MRHERHRDPELLVGEHHTGSEQTTVNFFSKASTTDPLKGVCGEEGIRRALSIGPETNRTPGTDAKAHRPGFHHLYKVSPEGNPPGEEITEEPEA